MNLKSYNGTIISNIKNKIFVNNFNKINCGFYLYFKHIPKGNYKLNIKIENLTNYFKIFLKHNNLRLTYLDTKKNISFKFNCDIFNVHIGILSIKISKISLIVNQFNLIPEEKICNQNYYNEKCKSIINSSKVCDLITILMPCYNSEKTLDKAIESIINQSYKKWELIIIDDYSIDNSVKIINKYIKNNSKIKLIQNEMNYGTYFSLNEGLKISKGQFITKLDSDDYYHIDKIKEQLYFCIKNQFECCLCNIIRFNTINNNEKQENNNSSILFSRKVFNTIGYYDNCRFECDSEYFMRIKKYFKVGHIYKNLYFAYISPNSLTTSIITGVGFNTIGNKIRTDFRKKYNTINRKFITHPKYIRSKFQVNPILRCPIEIQLIGNYKIIDNDKFIIEKLDNKLIGIVSYKLTTNKNILYNPNNYYIKIKTIGREVISDFTNNSVIYFTTKFKYVLLILDFKRKTFEYSVPLIKNFNSK